uniref:Chitin-binding type-2 domain-containing protein n=1 Tax=Stomoxys calcitrans TaxID=35570 RepID=A0A1I8NNA6_STOCA
MKFFICLSILACLLACALSCDPDSNNQPTCGSGNVNVPIRNFWDPTAYWLCGSSGATAELVRCPDAHLFDSAKGECVMWNEWEWTFPCPENN